MALDANGIADLFAQVEARAQKLGDIESSKYFSLTVRNWRQPQCPILGSAVANCFVSIRNTLFELAFVLREFGELGFGHVRPWANRRTGVGRTQLDGQIVTAGFCLPIHAHRHLQELLAGVKPLDVGCLQVGSDSPRIRREWNEIGATVGHKSL